MPAYQDSSFDLGGAYGQARLGIDASLAALQARQLDLNRSNQAGQVSQVLDPEVDYGQLIYDQTADYNKRLGRPDNAPIDKATWLSIVRSVAPLSDDVLNATYDRFQAMPAGERNPVRLGTLIQGAAQTATPSLAARQLAQQGSQFGQTFGETQRQFDQTLANRRKEAEWGAGNDLLKLAAGLRGPENYFQYANMLSGAEGSDQLQFARQAAQGTPQAAFRAWGQGTPATVGGLVGQPATQNPPGIPSPGTGTPFTGSGQPGEFRRTTQPGAPPAGQELYRMMGQQASTPGAQGIAQQAASAGTTPGGQDQLLALLQGKQSQQAGTQAGQAVSSQPAGAGVTPAGVDPLTGLLGRQFQQANPGDRNTPTGQQSRPGTALPEFIQPHQLNVRDYASWQPTQKKMYTSSLEARGYEPDDYFETARRAAPKGQAASTQRWR